MSKGESSTPAGVVKVSSKRLESIDVTHVCVLLIFEVTDVIAFTLLLFKGDESFFPSPTALSSGINMDAEQLVFDTVGVDVDVADKELVLLASFIFLLPRTGFWPM